jgi:hypothetical protein
MRFSREGSIARVKMTSEFQEATLVAETVYTKLPHSTGKFNARWLWQAVEKQTHIQ